MVPAADLTNDFANFWIVSFQQISLAKQRGFNLARQLEPLLAQITEGTNALLARPLGGMDRAPSVITKSGFSRFSSRIQCFPRRFAACSTKKRSRRFCVGRVIAKNLRIDV
jgi:hypothetical protein